MYWHNPIISATLLDGTDPVADCWHQGRHRLFYDPAVPVDRMVRLITLQDTCKLANRWLLDPFSIDQDGELDKVANVVRINQFVHSLQHTGNIKPMLLNYRGQWPLGASTGGSRLMAAERCANITAFSAFITTSAEFESQFDHLEPVSTLARFCELSGGDQHTEFYFRLTDAAAPWGLDWYEAALAHTHVPSNQQCLNSLYHYLRTQPADFQFSPQWFDSEIDWQLFDVINHSR